MRCLIHFFLVVSGLLPKTTFAQSIEPSHSSRIIPNLPSEVPGKEGLSRVWYSPVAVAVHPQMSLCLSANRDRHSVSLVNWQTGICLAECSVPGEPVDVIWLNGKQAVVSLTSDRGICLLAYESGQLRWQRTVAVGWEARGLARTSRNTVLCCVSGDDAVLEIEFPGGQILRKWSISAGPTRVVVTEDGSRAAVCSSEPAHVTVLNLESGRIEASTALFDQGFQPGIPGILPGSTELVIPVLTNRQLPIHAQNIMRGWVIDNRIARLDLTDPDPASQRHLALDEVDRGAGDVFGLAVDASGKWMVVSCSGTHDLAILDLRRVAWPPAHPGDHLLEELEDRPEIYRRVRVGGRPLDLEFIDSDRVLIANHLLDSLQIFDLSENRVIRTLPLGQVPDPDPVRRGEAIFYDAERSFHGWFSCHSCHPDGHTSGQLFDSVNDETFDTLKLTPTLRGVTETGPWTWHGWQRSLDDAMRKSLKDTLHSEQPIADEDVDALLAFLATRRHPVRSLDPGKATIREQGKMLFHGKAGCIQCHRSPFWTSDRVIDVGLGYSQQFFEGFNPPSLRGLRDRRRYLHDGRARSLQDLLLRHHRPESLGHESLNEQERSSLIQFLNSL